MERQANVGASLKECYEKSSCITVEVGADGTIIGEIIDETCIRDCNNNVMESQREIFPCDTSVNIALTADQAKTNGGYVGFRSTLSYMELRNMQEDTGFISRDKETGLYKCVRSTGIYDAIVCPEGYIKQNEYDVLNGCEKAGLSCGSFQCVCRPCVKAFDVDVFPIEDNEAEREPCEKVRKIFDMSLIFFNSSFSHPRRL